MNPWSNQISAQIVNRMQREGVEVVESPFEREWQPGLIKQFIAIAMARLNRQIAAHTASQEHKLAH
jgi:hypothetical protein